MDERNKSSSNQVKAINHKLNIGSLDNINDCKIRYDTKVPYSTFLFDKIIATIGCLFLIGGPQSILIVFYYIGHTNIYGNFICLINFIVFGLTTICFFNATYKSPGFIPRLPDSCTVYDAITGSYRKSQPLKYVEIPINGQLLKIKFCTTCNIYRPPRTVHCSSCGGCVERFDHHCPWIANCVGARNYTYFFMMLSLCSISILFIMILTCITLYLSLRYKTNTEWDTWKAWIIFGFGTLYTVVEGWLIIGLLAFHWYILSKNYTTYDKIKNQYNDYNPFARSMWLNCITVLVTGCNLAPPFTIKTSRIQRYDKVIFSPAPGFILDLDPKDPEDELNNSQSNDKYLDKNNSFKIKKKKSRRELRKY